jgi:transposase
LASILGSTSICTAKRDEHRRIWLEPLIRATNNAEIAYTPTNSSWLNRIEAQFTAVRYFALDGTDHASHQEQASMIRRYVTRRNNHAYDERPRCIVDRVNVA